MCVRRKDAVDRGYGKAGRMRRRQMVWVKK